MPKCYCVLDLDSKSVDFSRKMLASFLDSYNVNVSVEALNEFKSAIAELVSNAVIHSQGTLVTIELNYKEDEKCVYITVTDDGIGIEDIEKAKEPLYTSCGNESRAGLGFTIVEVFSDTMEILSKPNCGTIVKTSKKVN